jgi:imidazoleglycerol-phosphate dehydratase
VSRRAETRRTTGETDVRAAVDLDGSGIATVSTGVGFFDHMLTLFARHSLIDVEVDARGDLETGSHHTVEDVGITLGQAIPPRRSAASRPSCSRSSCAGWRTTPA